MTVKAVLFNFQFHKISSVPAPQKIKGTICNAALHPGTDRQTDRQTDKIKIDIVVCGDHPSAVKGVSKNCTLLLLPLIIHPNAIEIF